jgi:tryptophan synthase beta chain
MSIDAPHRFGNWGGRYVAETLVPALEELEAAFALAQADGAYRTERDRLLRDWVGRPTPLFFAENLSKLARCAHLFEARGSLRTPARTRSTTTVGQALLAQAPREASG